MNRQLCISTAASRTSCDWRPQYLTWDDLCKRLSTFQTIQHTHAAYMNLPKPQQDALKDIGGYVGGPLDGTRRKSKAVAGRDLVTLDFDNLTPDTASAICQNTKKLQCRFAIYSTAKSCAEKPRLRIVIPLDRMATPDEYEPLARRLAQYIGIDYADPTTFQASRLMYWPTTCIDTPGFFVRDDGNAVPASVDRWLATYTNWRNFMEWPRCKGDSPDLKKLAAKQGDPLTKPGIVGAFCRAYDISAAIDRFLADIYIPCGIDGEGRYTYSKGSTAGGAVLYDNGKFLYSHHATDPCSMRLVNAFDLVRIHLYGDKDDTAKENTPSNKLPSYKAMCEMALQDSAVQAIYNREQAEQLQADFGNVVPISSTETGSQAEQVEGEVIGNDGQQTDPNAWMSQLKRDTNGKLKQTIDNALLILNNDPYLCGRFMLNEFTGRGEVLAPLPWDKDPDKFKRRAWADSDIAGTYWYMEKGYEITKRSAIDAALDVHAATRSFNEVQNFLSGLAWDNVCRLDTLLIDYLGAEDSTYTRAVTRKAFVGAVARAMTPGCKFDNMLILCGPQGLGKSTLLDRMSKGWFNDGIRTFEGKEASELLQGVWLVEVAELDAFRRTDVSRIKQFLSVTSDRYRAAYGRNVKEFPRRCVFFGTCNVSDFLQDTTGNRRFWPVDVGIQPIIRHAWDLTEDEINQIWAEAMIYWRLGEPLYLSGEVAEAARQYQEAHREVSSNEGTITEFIEREVPSDWLQWPLEKRRDYWAGACKGQDIKTVPRDRICPLEIWCELFNRPNNMPRNEGTDIRRILDSLPNWKRTDNGYRFGPGSYQNQRGYTRI